MSEPDGQEQDQEQGQQGPEPPLNILEPYGQIARAIATQLAQLCDDDQRGDRTIEGLYVRAVRVNAGAFIGEVEREWWLVLQDGDLISVTIREVDGNAVRPPEDIALIYDRSYDRYDRDAAPPPTPSAATWSAT